jgi:hypothetical protein
MCSTRISCVAPLRGSRSLTRSITSSSSFSYINTLEPMLARRILKLTSHGDSQRRFFSRSLARHIDSVRFTRPINPAVVSKQMHSSAQKLMPASTTTMEFTPSDPYVVEANTPRPSREALKTLFIASAIPMVGFGFMDNLVMIQAGQYIDSTLGVSLGLATMTAAAAGQVVSDVSGVVFGGTLERFLHRTKLIENPLLTTAQRQLAICRNVSMFGAIVGVTIGCALGALSLLFVDLDKRERIQHAVMLREIVDDMIAEQEGNHFECQSCVIYVEHESDFAIPANDESTSSTTRMQALHEASSPAVLQCANERQVDSENDGHILYIPILKGDKLLAVLQLNQKEDASKGFTPADQQIARVMAQHIAIFMDRMAKK